VRRHISTGVYHTSKYIQLNWGKNIDTWQQACRSKIIIRTFKMDYLNSSKNYYHNFKINSYKLYFGASTSFRNVATIYRPSSSIHWTCYVHYDPSGRAISPTQTPLSDTQHSQQTDIHVPCGNSNPQSQQARGHRSSP